MMNNDDTFFEVSSFNSEDRMVYLLMNIKIRKKMKMFRRKTNSKNGFVCLLHAIMNIRQFIVIHFSQDTINLINLEDFKNILNKVNDSFQKSEMMTLYTFGKIAI